MLTSYLTSPPTYNCQPRLLPFQRSVHACSCYRRRRPSLPSASCSSIPLRHTMRSTCTTPQSPAREWESESGGKHPDFSPGYRLPNAALPEDDVRGRSGSELPTSSKTRDENAGALSLHVRNMHSWSPCFVKFRAIDVGLSFFHGLIVRRILEFLRFDTLSAYSPSSAGCRWTCF